MRLGSDHSDFEKQRWKIVRRDHLTDVPGEIVAADETTGECCMQIGDESKLFAFGPNGIRIVGRKR